MKKKLFRKIKVLLFLFVFRKKVSINLSMEEIKELLEI